MMSSMPSAHSLGDQSGSNGTVRKGNSTSSAGLWSMGMQFSPLLPQNSMSLMEKSFDFPVGNDNASLESILNYGKRTGQSSIYPNSLRVPSETFNVNEMSGDFDLGLTFSNPIDTPLKRKHSKSFFEDTKLDEEESRRRNSSIGSQSISSAISPQNTNERKSKVAASKRIRRSSAQDNDSLFDDETDGDSRSTAQGAKWTRKEDEELRDAVNKCHGKDWKKIAACLTTGKNHVQCLQRWKQVLQPGLIKGPWTKEEDEKLTQLMKVLLAENKTKSGNKKVRFGQWKKIETFMQGRTAKQCRERWVLNLDPDINKSEWTEEEDLRLMNLQSEYGNSWSKIKSLLATKRTENSVKLRFNFLKRQRSRYGEDQMFKYIDYRKGGNGAMTGNPSRLDHTERPLKSHDSQRKESSIRWSLYEDEAIILAKKYFNMPFSNEQFLKQLESAKPQIELARRWEYLCSVDKSLMIPGIPAREIELLDQHKMKKIWEKAAQDAAKVHKLAGAITPSNYYSSKSIGEDTNRTLARLKSSDSSLKDNELEDILRLLDV